MSKTLKEYDDNVSDILNLLILPSILCMASKLCQSVNVNLDTETCSLCNSFSYYACDVAIS